MKTINLNKIVNEVMASHEREKAFNNMIQQDKTIPIVVKPSYYRTRAFDYAPVLLKGVFFYEDHQRNRKMIGINSGATEKERCRIIDSYTMEIIRDKEEEIKRLHEEIRTINKDIQKTIKKNWDGFAKISDELWEDLHKTKYELWEKYFKDK